MAEQQTIPKQSHEEAWPAEGLTRVLEDQVLAAVMTDKATVEIPSPIAGTTAMARSRSACAIAPSFTPVLCNRYGSPMVEFKMACRQGDSREHVLCDM